MRYAFSWPSWPTAVPHHATFSGVSSATLASATTGALATVSVVPYRCDETPDPALGPPLTIAFHHEGASSSNVVDPRLWAYAFAARASGVPLDPDTATMVVVEPPAGGFLALPTASATASALMEVPMARLADLRYVSLSGGSNDAVRVRFSHAPGRIGAAAQVVVLKHYVYTSAGRFTPSGGVAR